MQKKRFILMFVICLCLHVVCHASQTLTAKKVDNPPVIDGIGSDDVWKNAEEIFTHDKVADIDISLKSVYTDSEIFFLVSFPDEDESRTHKSWVWDEIIKLYTVGGDREDCFVIKWNMEPHPVDLSIRGGTEYRADTWYWKACRTDPSGYADDKIQILSVEKTEDSLPVLDGNGGTMYLVRQGDKGRPAYKTKVQIGYRSDVVPRYKVKEPFGSRADIRAKGLWRDGAWTIEFGRKLKTGNKDDVQLDVSGRYLFGVSRYETAGRKPDAETAQPLYGSGDVSEDLSLRFEKKQ